MVVANASIHASTDETVAFALQGNRNDRDDFFSLAGHCVVVTAIPREGTNAARYRCDSTRKTQHNGRRDTTLVFDTVTQIYRRFRTENFHYHPSHLSFFWITQRVNYMLFAVIFISFCLHNRNDELFQSGNETRIILKYAILLNKPFFLLD